MFAQRSCWEYADSGKQRKDFTGPNFYTAAVISAMPQQARATRCKMGMCFAA
jgi:hypothetical protein